MNKKMSKRQRDIKSKLMAAICMLLVSSIMMVSTTYAWFTLSTAPEVTGITTAVGANGNLEMALLPTDALTTTAADYGITSGVGDSFAGESPTVKNTTWGNLVDLSDKSFYGMDQLVLYPAALNVATWDDDNAKLNPTQIAATILSTPAYGADGRVSALKADTTTSTYVAADKNFPQNNNYGVRAVGNASGMTDRQLAYRNARSAASTAMAQAKTFASQSLNTNGNALANIALAHGVDSSAKHSQADVKALLAIVDDLLGTDSTTGVLDYAENAYKNYIIAYAASAASEKAGMDDTTFKAFQSSIESAASLTAVKTLLSGANITLTAPIGSAIDALIATRATVEGAQTDLEALLDSTKADDEKYIEWSVISEPLYDLADTDAMQINGYAASTVKDNMNAIVNDVTAGKGLTITIATGGGVYADVADHCGDYTAQITIEEVSYGGMTLNNMPARMETSTTVDDTPINAENGNYGNVYLGLLSNAVKDAGEPAGTGQVMPISDFYGYIIDLAFRTNAAESNLLLRTTPADRIYSDNKDASADTMGSGSTMTFTATTTDFTAEDMKGLMDCIRIVFFDPASNVVYATGMLDTSSATTGDGGTSVTANIYLYENKSSATNYETYDAEKDTNVTASDRYNLVVTYRKAADGEEATHALVSGTTDTFEAVTENATHVEVKTYEQSDTGIYKKVVTAGGHEMNKIESEATITALAQNAAKAVSVLVYLDGETITNADVAASASTSMSGSMNLQFASSANLVPMQYTPLVSQGTSTETTTAAATTLNSISTSGAAGTVTTSGSFDASGNVTINLTGVADTETVSAVTVGGTAVTSFTYASGKLTFTQEGITADSVIAITIGNA